MWQPSWLFSLESFNRICIILCESILRLKNISIFIYTHLKCLRVVERSDTLGQKSVNCKPTTVCAGNQTAVFCKSSKSTSQSHHSVSKELQNENTNLLTWIRWHVPSLWKCDSGISCTTNPSVIALPTVSTPPPKPLSSRFLISKWRRTSC